ncbi:MAG: NUDIX hydrolase [Chitinophagales bacterium]
MTYNYDYPRPSLTVDCLVFGYDTKTQKLNILLIQRKNEPFQNHWALPGGFVDMDESLETAAIRELKEETGAENILLEQFYTFGSPQRDPRGRVISVAYYTLISPDSIYIKAADDAKAVGWFDTKKLPPLAFDHQKILNIGLERLKTKLQSQPIGLELLPNKFLFSALQKMYESILEAEIEPQNFRKKMLTAGLLHELDKEKEQIADRLYTFDKTKYTALLKNNKDFKLKMLNFLA